MNIYLMIAILLANVIAIAIVYQFIKRLEKKQKLIFIASSVALMYVLISIVYWFSGFGIDENVHEVSKNFVLYLFVPVNVILFIPYLASQYMKLRKRNIKIEKFINRLSALIVLLIVVLVFEYFYFRNIQENIKNMDDIQNEVTNTEVEIKNEAINEAIESQNVMNNEVISNVIENHNLIQNELISNVVVNEL